MTAPRFHRHQRGFTPYNWSIKPGGGWRIGYGASSYLVAEGSGWSRPMGRKMLDDLNREYRRGNAIRRAK